MTNESDFFQLLPIRAVSSATLPDVLADSAAVGLTILFLWGRDCPNCDIAKAAILMRRERFLWPDVRWLHCNVYGDAEMATRFSLHGIPVFLLFRGSRALGRITSWPGAERFAAAVEKQRSQGGLPAVRPVID
jgi:hypothetical protein